MPSTPNSPKDGSTRGASSPKAQIQKQFPVLIPKTNTSYGDPKDQKTMTLWEAQAARPDVQTPLVKLLDLLKDHERFLASTASPVALGLEAMFTVFAP